MSVPTVTLSETLFELAESRARLFTSDCARVWEFKSLARGGR